MKTLSSGERALLHRVPATATQARINLTSHMVLATTPEKIEHLLRLVSAGIKAEA